MGVAIGDVVVPLLGSAAIVMLLPGSSQHMRPLLW